MKILILPFNRWTRHRVVAGSFVCGKKSRAMKHFHSLLLYKFSSVWYDIKG